MCHEMLQPARILRNLTDHHRHVASPSRLIVSHDWVLSCLGRAFGYQAPVLFCQLGRSRLSPFRSPGYQGGILSYCGLACALRHAGSMNEPHDSRQPFRVISWLDHALLAPGICAVSLRLSSFCRVPRSPWQCVHRGHSLGCGPTFLVLAQ